MKKICLLFLVGTFILFGCANKKQLSKSAQEDQLNGTWELEYISGPRIAFDGLYNEKKPSLTFDLANKRMHGNSSCNNLNGALVVDGNKIDFNGPIAMTRMLCPGEGENVFVKTLKDVNTFGVSDDNKLSFFMGDVAVMRFKKIEK